MANAIARRVLDWRPILDAFYSLLIVLLSSIEAVLTRCAKFVVVLTTRFVLTLHYYWRMRDLINVDKNARPRNAATMDCVHGVCYPDTIRSIISSVRACLDAVVLLLY